MQPAPSSSARLSQSTMTSEVVTLFNHPVPRDGRVQPSVLQKPPPDLAAIESKAKTSTASTSATTSRRTSPTLLHSRSPSQCSLISVVSSATEGGHAALQSAGSKYPVIQTMSTQREQTRKRDSIFVRSRSARSQSQMTAEEQFEVCPVFVPLADGCADRPRSRLSMASSMSSEDSLMQDGVLAAKEGYLMKQCEPNAGSRLLKWHSWRRRYFVLQGSALYYFRSQVDARRYNAEPLGVIPLKGFFGVTQETEDLDQEKKHSVRKHSILRQAPLAWLPLRRKAPPLFSKATDCSTEKARKVASDSKGPWSFHLETAGRVWTLAADSEAAMTEWLLAFQALLRCNQSRARKGSAALLDPEWTPVPPLKGWLEKHQRGTVAKRWFQLQSDRLEYFRSEKDPEPIGFIPFETAHLEIAFYEDDSDDDELDHTQILGSGIQPNNGFIRSSLDRLRRRSSADFETYRFAIHTPEKSYWLRAATRKEVERWTAALIALMPPLLMHQSMAEQTLATAVHTILEGKDDCNLEKEDSRVTFQSILEQCPALKYQAQPLEESLTTLGSQRLVQEALKCFQAVLLFFNIEIRSDALDYHVALVQSLSSKCLFEIELQNEVLLQVVKQIEGCPTREMETRLWLLLALLLGVFLPTRTVYPFIRLQLVRNMMDNPNVTCSSLATYCFHLLDRALKGYHDIQGKVLVCRNREQPPSRLEFDAVLNLAGKAHLSTDGDGIVSSVEILQIFVDIGVNSGQKLIVPIRVFDTVQQVTSRVAHAVFQSNDKRSGVELFSQSVGLFLLDPLIASRDQLQMDRLVPLSSDDFLADVLSRYELAQHFNVDDFGADGSTKSKKRIPRLILKARFVPAPKLSAELLANGLRTLNKMDDRLPRNNSYSSLRALGLSELVEKYRAPVLLSSPDVSAPATVRASSSTFIRSIQVHSIADLAPKRRSFTPNVRSQRLEYASKLLTPPSSPKLSKATGEGCFFPEWYIIEQLMAPFVLTDVGMKPFNIQHLNDDNDSQTLTFAPSISLGSLRWQSMSSCASLSEKRFMCYQINETIRTHRYPISHMACLKLAALLSQLEWGDHYPLLESANESKVSVAVTRFCPDDHHPRESNTRIRRSSTNTNAERNVHIRLFERHNSLRERSNNSMLSKSVTLMADLSERWCKLRGFSVEQCVNIYLSYTMQWSLAGFYETFRVHIKAPQSTGEHLLSIGPDGIVILSSQLLTPLKVYPFTKVIQYGTKGDKTVTFMVDVSSTTKEVSREQETENASIKARLSTSSRRRSKTMDKPDTVLFSPLTSLATGLNEPTSKIKIGAIRWELELVQSNVRSKDVVDVLHACIQNMAQGVFCDLKQSPISS